MKIRVLSDLHTERYADYIEQHIPMKFKEKADVCVLAGDIFNCKNEFPEKLRKLLVDNHKHVLFVPGNHEYYGTNIQHIDIPGILNIDSLELKIDGVIFAGATLWSDIRDATQDELYGLNDFHLIEDFKEHHENYQKEHELAVDFLSQTNADVIVTHHLPTYMSVPERFLGSNFNKFFATEVDIKNIPKIWIHGHTHDCEDYYYKNTRYVCNPRGYISYYYPGAENNYFSWDKIIELN